jgi:type II secretory pathway pseudopilin PulG
MSSPEPILRTRDFHPSAKFSCPVSHWRASAFTRPELLLGLVVFAVLAAIGFVACPIMEHYPARARMTDQMNNGRQIYIAFRAYALETGREGKFPAERSVGSSKVWFANSNEAFEVLLPNYLDKVLAPK